MMTAPFHNQTQHVPGARPGLGLRRGEALRALSAWGATLYGAAAILALTPLAALGVLRLPLGSPDLALGLAVFCCMPTTLSSGVSLTQVGQELKLDHKTSASTLMLPYVTPSMCQEKVLSHNKDRALRFYQPRALSACGSCCNSCRAPRLRVLRATSTLALNPLSLYATNCIAIPHDSIPV